MVRLVWILLVSLSCLYSFAVYKNCNLNSIDKPDHKTLDGWQTWQEKNCQSCHQLFGLGGYMGPDLTNCYSMKGPQYMKGIIKHGTARMPSLQLQENEIENIIDYLRWVDQHGSSQVDPKSVHWTGTYIFQKK